MMAALLLDSFWRECGYEKKVKFRMVREFPLFIIRLYAYKSFVTQIIDSIVSHGCFLRDCKVEHSLIGLRSRLESGADVKVEYYCHIFSVHCNLL